MKLFERLRWLPTERPPPGHGGSFGEELGAGDVGRRHAGDEQREIQEVAAVHRQVPDLGLRDGAGDLAARRLEDDRLRVTVTLVSSRADFQRHRQLERRADGERQCAGDVGESLQPDRDVVAADFQVRQAEPSFLIGDRLARHVGVGVPRGHGRAGDGRPLWIGHPSTDAGGIDGLLGGDRRGEENECERQPTHLDSHLTTLLIIESEMTCRPDQPSPRLRRSAEALRAKAEGLRYTERIYRSRGGGASGTEGRAVTLIGAPASSGDVVRVT